MGVFRSFVESNSEFAVFCGAGISRESGIPVVTSFIDSLLLEISGDDPDQGGFPKELRDIIKYQWQFEAFMEKALKAFPHQKDQILSVFDDRKRALSPGSSHLWIAKQAKLGRVKTIYTTNFDRLIEVALEKEVGADQFEVLYQDSFGSPYSLVRITKASDKPIRVVKLHGCISDMGSIAVTMRSIVTEQNLPARDRALEELFNPSYLTHQQLVILGYSFSDQFDINRKIRTLDQSAQQIFFVCHTQDDQTLEEKPLKGIKSIDDPTGKTVHNPLKHLVGADSFWVHQKTDKEWESPSLPLKIKKQWWDHLSDIMKTTHHANRDIASAWLHYDLGNLDAATYGYQKIVDSEEIPEDEPLILGLAHEGLGEIYAKEGQIVEALEQFEEAGVAYSQGKLAFQEAGVLHSRAKVLMNSGDIGEAESLLKEALKRYEEIPDLFGVATVQGTFGVFEGVNKGNHQAALKYLEPANAYFTKHGHIQSSIVTQFRLGYLAEVSQNHDKAEKLYVDSTYLAQKYGINSLIANGFSYQANLAKLRGESEKVSRLYRQAENIFNAIGDEVQKAHTINDHAVFLRHAGKLDEALACFEHGKSIALKVNDMLFLAHTTNNIGSIHQAKGDVEEALSLYMEAEEYYRESDNMLGLAVNLNNQGMIREHMKNHTIAGKLYVEAVSLALLGGDHDIIARSFMNLGNSWRDQGFPDLAISHYEHAEYYNNSEETMAVLSNNYGVAHDAKKLHAEAQPFFEEAIRLAPKAKLFLHLPKFLEGLAINLEMQNKIIKAKQIANEAVIAAQEHHPESLGDIRNNLSGLL